MENKAEAQTQDDEFKSKLSEYGAHYIERALKFKKLIDSAKTTAKKAFYLKKMKKEHF